MNRRDPIFKHNKTSGGFHETVVRFSVTTAGSAAITLVALSILNPLILFLMFQISIEEDKTCGGGWGEFRLSWEVWLKAPC